MYATNARINANHKGNLKPHPLLQSKFRKTEMVQNKKSATMSGLFYFVFRISNFVFNLGFFRYFFHLHHLYTGH